MSAAPAAAGAAGLGISVTPAFDNPVVVGEQDQPGLLNFSNNSLGTAATETVTITDVRINPACSNSVVDTEGNSPCTSPEARPNPAAPILDLDGTSVAGTTCPGAPFTIAGPDAEGDYTFTPTNGALTLGPVGSAGATCTIAFTFDVVQRPTDGSTFGNAAIRSSSPTFPGPVPNSGNTVVTVNQAAATLTTQASTNSTSLAAGTSVTDTATVTGVTGGPAPTGTVTYTLVGPNPNGDCSAPVVGSPSTVAVGTASGSFTVTTPGIYNFVATYSGDTNYTPISTPVGCDVGDEMFTVAGSTTTTTGPPGSTTTTTPVITGTTAPGATTTTRPAAAGGVLSRTGGTMTAASIAVVLVVIGGLLWRGSWPGRVG